MIPSLRQQFNRGFTAGKYQNFLRQIDQACGTHVQFRLCETPCFFPKELLERMASDGKDLIRQLVDNPQYRAKSEEAVPAEFKVPNEAPHPMFVQVDFGLVRDAHGDLQPEACRVAGLPFPLRLPRTARRRLYCGLRTSRARLRASGVSSSQIFLERTRDRRPTRICCAAPSSDRTIPTM